MSYEDEWPIARTEYKKLYLSEQSQSLSLKKPDKQMEVMYLAKGGKALFNFKFAEGAELSGYFTLKVWVEARPERAGGPSLGDMAIFVAVNKLDRNGNAVHFNGSVGNNKDMVTLGCLKVFRRELDPVESTEWHRILKGDSEQKLDAGEIVPVNIELYPSSTFYAAGETLQLIVSSSEIIPSPPYKKGVEFNHGKHVLHIGGQYVSYLQMPMIPSKAKVDS